MLEQQDGARRVLVVEDNPGDIRLCEEVFREARIPVAVDIARDGADAITYLDEVASGERPPPDLVLLDLNLPRRSGRDVLQHAKSDPRTVAIPVLVLTTSVAESDVLACYRLHANAFVPKPLDFDQFATLVERVVAFWLEAVVLPHRIGRNGASERERW